MAADGEILRVAGNLNYQDRQPKHTAQFSTAFSWDTISSNRIFFKSIIGAVLLSRLSRNERPNVGGVSI